MNELTKPKSETDSRMRNRIGRIIFWMGIIFLISNVLVTAAISWIAPQTNFSAINSLALFGILLIFVGVQFVYATGEFSKDGLWALQTGPYVK
jgi:hypothetical protein